MNLPEFSVKKPVAITMVYLAIVVLSVVALTRLSLDILPEITFPSITIVTTYKGAGPEDIENKITTLIESALGIVSDLKEIRSTSVENMSIVRLLFNWGKDLNEASNDIRERLDFIKKFLPSEAESPSLLKFDLSQAPILFLTASAKQNYPRLNTILKDEIAEPLKRINGIGNVFVVGGLERQICVNIDKHRLSAFQLNLSGVLQALAMHNISQPAGDITIGKESFFLRTKAEFENINQIEETLVGYYQGKPIYLKDIAEVKDDFADPLMITRQEKDRSCLMIVQKRSGANTVKVANAVLKQLPDLKKRLPKDIDIRVAFNMAEDVKHTLNNLTQSVFFGGLLVIIVTYIFLSNLRSSLVILITIPISLIVAFLFLYIMGYTINIMSLSSIAIAIGMVVDTAIVVLENIVRHNRELNENIVDASINGTMEVGLAVSASTLTTIVVFLPLIFTSGIVGIMFKQLGAVISITLLVSLSISLTLSPLIASLIIKNKQESQSNFFLKDIGGIFNRYLDTFNRYLQDLLRYALNNRRLVIIISVAILLISLLLIPFIGTEFIPEQDSGFIQATITLPTNTPVEISDEFAVKLTQEAQKILGNDRLIIFSRSGQSPFGSGGMRQEGSNIIQFAARLVEKEKRKRSDKYIAELLRKRFSQIPGIWKIEFQTGDPSQQQIAGANKPLEVEIIGYDIPTTDALAQRVKGILEKIPGIVDISISRERGKLEYQFIIDRPKLAALGIPPQIITDTLSIAFGGRIATKYREGKDEYNVFVRLKPQDRKDINDVLNLTIRTNDGRKFILKDLIKEKLAQGPLTIERKDQQRIVTVGANIYKRTLGQVASDVEKEIKKIALPPGVFITISGTVKEQRDAFRDLFFAFLLGILLTYMVMAAQFESFRDPFIIMFAVPFGTIGALWALFLTGQTLNAVSFIGIVMLVGIVVNNAIVYVSYVIQLRAKNIDVRSALIETTRVRLRPILMTTLTTIFGMIPLAISGGQGAEVWRSLSIAVIGGLTISTLISLVLVPVFYSIFEERLPNKNKKLS